MMTKLEEKLKELGYELEIEEDMVIAAKEINGNADIVIGLWDGQIKHYYVYSYLPKHISSQASIDGIQQAFDIMKRDLEKLKNVKN